MMTVLVTILCFGVVMAAMAFGVIVSNKPLRGSCGGTGDDCTCSEAKRQRCETARAERSSDG